MKSNHKEIKDISTVKQEHVLEYIEHRQDNGLSGHTISKDMAALNKLFDLSITKKMANHAFRREYAKNKYKEPLGDRTDKNA